MSTALIVNAIRNMFARKPKPAPMPRRPIDGLLGQETRLALTFYRAAPDLPDLPAWQFWDVTSAGKGAFRVELWEHATHGPRVKTAYLELMDNLSPETIVAMSRTIMRATGGNR